MRPWGCWIPAPTARCWTSTPGPKAPFRRLLRLSAAEPRRRDAQTALAEREELALRLAELDRLDPKAGEETALAEERALLGAAEQPLADIAPAPPRPGG